MGKKIKSKKNFLRRKGFSFIESILAVFLVSVGVVAGLKLLTLGLKDSIDSRDQFAASLLAQEGVELVRNIRDNNWVDNNPDTASFNGIDGSTSNGIRKIDYNENTLTTNGGARLHMVGGFYERSGGTGTKFYRRIYIYNGTDTRIVTSVVIWSAGDWPSGFGSNMSDPSNDNTLKNCNTSTKCAYTQIILNKWGE